MTPEEANIIRYLEKKDYASTRVLAKRFRVSLTGIELVMRSLLSHGHVELDKGRYYRVTQGGRDDLGRFDDHFLGIPFDKNSRPI